MNFRIGQKVECVRDDWALPPGYEATAVPKVGERYTIRGIRPDARDFTGRTFLGLLLVEIRNPSCGLFCLEPGFSAADSEDSPNFRPVIERKTDISIFTALLNPARTPELIDD